VFFEEGTATVDTTMYQYEWDLGDNSKVRAIEAKHCFAKDGDYVISLNVIDKLTGEILFNQAEYQLEVRPDIQSFITSADTVKFNESVLFDARQSYFGDDVAAETYSWDFRDGDKTTGETALHTFLYPGKFDVRLGIKEKDAVDGNENKNNKKKTDPDAPPTEVILKFARYKTIVVTEN